MGRAPPVRGACSRELYLMSTPRLQQEQDISIWRLLMDVLDVKGIVGPLVHKDAGHPVTSLKRKLRQLQF